MGSFCTSKPQTTQTSQTQTYTPNPAIAGAGNQAIGMAQSAAQQPFQTPAAPVAPFNPFQQQAFSQYQGLQGGTNPFFQNASSNMNTAQAPVTQADTASFMNPYADQALADMKKYVFDPQRISTMGQATQQAGGVGADRLALTSQNLDKTQADALGQAQAGFYGQALGAAQQSKQQALQSAQGWANLGVGQQGAQLQATGALAGAGAQQQAQTQAQLMSPYEQTLAQIAYPYQQTQFLAGITGGLAGAMGGTTQGQGTQTIQPSQPSMLNQIAGLGMAGLGAYGAFGGLFGGSGGGATSVPNSPNASMYTGNPIYAGFGPTYAEGGSVNPWDLGQGFAPGGDVEEYSPDEFNPIDAAASRPTDYQEKEFSPHELVDAAKNYYGPFVDSIRGAGSKLNSALENYGSGPGFYPGASASPVAPAAAADMPPPQRPNPWAVPPNAGTMPMPGAYRNPLPPAIPSQMPQPTRVAQLPQSPDRTGGYGLRPLHGINSDMKISDFEMPKEKQPYPDATSRDWGQNLARSPWMSLVQAGLKTAQSTKRGVAGLAEGLESGVQHLDTQRKELRSEQQINQKAEELYRHAKTELDKYTRKTPHELATEGHQAQALAQGKFQFVNYTDPQTGQLKVGRADTKHGTITDPTTGQVVNAGRLMGRASATGVLSPGNIVSIQNAVNNDVTIPAAKKDAEIQKRIDAAAAAAAQQHNAGANQPQPPQGAIEALKLNPGLRADFEAKYPGWAAKVLGE